MHANYYVSYFIVLSSYSIAHLPLGSLCCVPVGLNIASYVTKTHGRHIPTHQCQIVG